MTTTIAVTRLILFPLALFLTRVVTRSELSSLEPFDLVLLLVLGDMLLPAQSAAADSRPGRSGWPTTP